MQTLHLQQLKRKMEAMSLLGQVATPPTGWIKSIRTALGMSMQQLGRRLNVSKQSIMDMERREGDGSITIKSLREFGRVMDMKLVYGFVPNEGTLDELIEKRATEVAIQIVMRTANSMALEGQSNSTERLEAAIKERAMAILNERPKVLWD